jgi:septal ring factor EnvC (AmiA/AmiB activator)
MTRTARILAAMVLALCAAPLLHAQNAQERAQDRRAQLESAKADAARAERRAADLERAAASERDQAAQARAQEAAAASRIEAAQAGIRASQAQIGLIDAQLQRQRTRLAERQTAIVNLVAALQSMARRPAVLALAQPGSVSDVVHVRAVLGATLPVVQARTADVRAELDRSRRLRAQGLAAVEALRDGRTRLEGERLALVKLEGEHRLRSRDLGRTALFESDRAIALGERARDIVDQMQATAGAADTAEALASLSGPLPRPAATGSAPPSPGPLPPYRLPVAGTIVAGLGEVSENGVRSRGLTLATAASAPVVAPAAGKILFAAPFRDYGRVVIIDHGQGWTSLIAGLDHVAVSAGDRVNQGSALGTAAAGEQPHVTVELRRRNEPVDLTALLD